MNTILRPASNPWWRLLATGIALAGLAAPLLADDLKDGRNALQAGRLDQAVEAFERAAQQGQAEGRAGVGLVWLKRHQYAKAMDAFQTAQKMDANLAVAWYGQGEVLREQEKCDQAAPLLRKAVELDRKYPEAQLALAHCLVELKRFDEAATAANRGVNWGPKWRPKFLIALGDVSAGRDSLRQAGIWYTSAKQESPDDPSTRRALGDFYVQRGTYELAFPEYQAAVAMDSSDVELRYALARALDFGNRASDALREYGEVVARDADYPPGELGLGQLLYRAGAATSDKERFQAARAPLEKYVQLRPDDVRGWSFLGRDLYKLGTLMHDQALKDQGFQDMVKAEQMGDKQKDLYAVLARAYAERGEAAKSQDYFALAGSEAMKPEDLLRMAVQLESKEPVRADSIYSAVFLMDTTSWQGKIALTQMGKMKFKAKDYPGAVGVFERRIALDPKAGESYYYMGLSYKEMKQYPQALEALRTAAGQDSAKPERHLWLGILYQQVDSLPQARREFERAVELDSTSSGNKALALRQVGYFRLVGKEYDGAIDALERSTQMNPADMQALVWLGQAYQNSGNRAKALEVYGRILARDPGNGEALKGKRSLEGGTRTKQGGAP
jgi:tetratricopeptide (TPR) repeat protein